MEKITFQDNSVMEIFQEDNTWNIRWHKENDFDITIRNLTRKGVDDYISVIAQEMEEPYEPKE